jgi:putative addiction module component (TIGR02574 family)
MNDDVDELTRQALKLSPAERARLVKSILETLDEPDAAVDAQWRTEVERRADGMDDGTRTATPWNEARRKLGL